MDQRHDIDNGAESELEPMDDEQFVPSTQDELEPEALDRDVPEEPEAPEAEEADEAKPQWYVVHCYSGYENKVKKNLEHRAPPWG